MKKIKLLTISFISLTILFSGCGTIELKSTKVEKRISNNPVEGIVYYLPKTEFNVNTSFIIQECRLINYEVVFNVTELISVSYKPVSDFSNAYYIGLDSFNKASKESSIEISLYDNGMIKSINTSVEDKTGEIIVNTAKTVGKIALYATAPEMAIASSYLKDLPPKPIPLCEPDVEEALTTIDGVKNKLTNAQNGVKNQLGGIKDMRDNNATEDSLNNAYTNLWALNKVMKENQKDYDDLLSILTISTTKIFSNSYNTVITPDKKILKKKIISDKRVDEIQKKLERNFIIENAKNNTVSNHNSEQVFNGILYKQPAIVEIKVCDLNSSKCSYKEEKSIPGIGVLASLPFTNGSFESNHLEAEFSNTGMLTKVKYSSNSKALAISETALSVADEYKDYKINKATLSKLEKESKLTDITNEINLMTKLKELEKLKKGDSELSLIQSQIDLQTKLNELEKLKEINTAYNDIKREYEIKKLLADIEIIDDADLTRKLQTKLLQIQVEEAQKAFDAE